MNIRNRRALKEGAAQALARGRDPRKLILAYAGISTLVTLAAVLLDYWLDQKISGTGGLSNFGTRGIYSTIQILVSVVQSILIIGVDYGYISGIIRISRRQYADHTDLKMGLRRFGPILRYSLLEALVYMGIMLISSYAGILIFLFTPLSSGFTELAESMIGLSPTAVIDDAAMSQLIWAMVPAFVMILVIFLVLAVPLRYRLRMAKFCLMDENRVGAMEAFRESRQMMKGNRFSLFRLDLSFWWYFVLQQLTVALCYGDMILQLQGVSLPMNSALSFYLFYFLYLAANFALMYFFQNRVELTYAAAYNTLRPKPQSNGVVLGNIFDM